MQFNPLLDSIKTYEAGKPIELVVREYGVAPEAVIKLASNENPFGPGPNARKAIVQAADQIHRYPDDSFFALKAALGARLGVQSDQMIIGAGSDQVFDFITRALLQPGDRVLQNRVTFAMYAIYAAQVGAQVVSTRSDTHDLGQFESLMREHRPKLIYLCTPSNPAGDALDREAIYAFLERVPETTLVVVDGAYMEYAAYRDEAKRIEPAELIARFPNTIYTGTFSKAYGLGGMRVGYGIAPASTIAALMKMRPPFNITNLSALAATAALEDGAHLSHAIAHNFKEMARYEAFAHQMGFSFIPSYTNFIALLFGEAISATAIAQKLLQKGVIVRDLKSYGMNAIRVTIGLEAENDRFFECFKEVF